MTPDSAQTTFEHRQALIDAWKNYRPDKPIRGLLQYWLVIGVLILMPYYFSGFSQPLLNYSLIGWGAYLLYVLVTWFRWRRIDAAKQHDKQDDQIGVLALYFGGIGLFFLYISVLFLVTAL